MANEKVICDKADLVAIADAVREKNGSSDTYYVSELAEAVEAISGGGGVELPELENPGVASDLISGKELIDEDGNIVEGTMPNNGAMTVPFNPMTSSEIQIPKGYHDGNGKTVVTPAAAQLVNAFSGGSDTDFVEAMEIVKTNVSTQALIISNIQAALEGKAAVGGMGGPTVVDVGDEVGFQISVESAYKPILTISPYYYQSPSGFIYNDSGCFTEPEWEYVEEEDGISTAWMSIHPGSALSIISRHEYDIELPTDFFSTAVSNLQFSDNLFVSVIMLNLDSDYKNSYDYELIIRLNAML